MSRDVALVVRTSLHQGRRAGLASALVVRRQIDRLDMVGALKTRE